MEVTPERDASFLFALFCQGDTSSTPISVFGAHIAFACTLG